MIKRQLIRPFFLLLLGFTLFPEMNYVETETMVATSFGLPQQNEQQSINAIFSLTEDNTQWMRTYGGARDEITRSVLHTTDGGFILAGTTGFSISWLMKTDNIGNLQWIQYYNLSYPNTVIETMDGGFTLVGSRTDYVRKTSEATIAKTDAHGTIQWYQTYTWEGLNEAQSVFQTIDNGYIMGGSSSASTYTIPGTITYKSDWSAWLVKLDSNGNREWFKKYGGEDHDTLQMVIPTIDEGYAFLGDTWSYGEGYNDMWVVKTDNRGKIQWNRTYGGLGADKGYKILEMPTGDFILIGGTTSFGAGDVDAWIVKTDVMGNVQWNRTYGDGYYNSAYSGALTTDGGFILTGTTTTYRTERRLDLDVWILKLNSRGLLRWEKVYGGLGDDEADSIVQTVDGGYILAGKSNSYEETGGVRDKKDWDALLVRTNAEGVAPNIEIELINLFEIGLIVILGIGAVTVLVLYVRAVRRSRPKW